MPTERQAASAATITQHEKGRCVPVLVPPRREAGAACTCAPCVCAPSTTSVTAGVFFPPALLEPYVFFFVSGGAQRRCILAHSISQFSHGLTQARSVTRTACDCVVGAARLGLPFARTAARRFFLNLDPALGFSVPAQSKNKAKVLTQARVQAQAHAQAQRCQKLPLEQTAATDRLEPAGEDPGMEKPTATWAVSRPMNKSPGLQPLIIAAWCEATLFCCPMCSHVLVGMVPITSCLYRMYRHPSGEVQYLAGYLRRAVLAAASLNRCRGR